MGSHHKRCDVPENLAGIEDLVRHLELKNGSCDGSDGMRSVADGAVEQTTQPMDRQNA